MSNEHDKKHNADSIPHDKKVEGGKNSHNNNHSSDKSNQKNNSADNIPHDKKVEGGKNSHKN